MIDPRKDALKTRGKSKLAAASAVAKKDAPLAPSPSSSEAKAIADAQERTAARRARIAVLAEPENGALRISPPHSDDAGFATRLLDAFAETESPAFANRAMERLRRRNAAQELRASDAKTNLMRRSRQSTALGRRMKLKRCSPSKWSQRMRRQWTCCCVPSKRT